MVNLKNLKNVVEEIYKTHLNLFYALQDACGEDSQNQLQTNLALYSESQIKVLFLNNLICNFILKQF